MTPEEPSRPSAVSVHAASTLGPFEPCRDPRRPDDPVHCAEEPTIALALSGGGFRATLAALGVIRLLADVGLLGHVRFVSSVSGGSITAGVLARQWAQLRTRGYTTDAVDDLIVQPVVSSISCSSMTIELLRNLWRTVGPRTRSDVLQRVLDRRFFHGQTLEDLDGECRFIINAANLTTGVRFAFERDVVGDYRLGLALTADADIPLARAAAASCAVPGYFPPLPMPGVGFPCLDTAGAPQLLDGGTYDNTGLEALDGPNYHDVFIIAMNAGGLFHGGPIRGLPVLRDLNRSEDSLYRQSTALRTRWMVDRFRAWDQAHASGAPIPDWARQGVLVSLGTTLDGARYAAWREQFRDERTWKGKDLAQIPTVFSKLPEELCQLLLYRAWWLIGAAVAGRYPNLLPQSQYPKSPPPLPVYVQGRQ